VPAFRQLRKLHGLHRKPEGSVSSGSSLQKLQEWIMKIRLPEREQQRHL
jgi:hypothetical protein